MSEEINEETLKNAASKVTAGDAQKVVKNKRKITKRASHGLMKNMVADIKVLICLVHDWASGTYPYAPWFTMSSIITALLWILNPMDLIPDALPLLGLLDDISVLSLCLAMTSADVKDYIFWKKLRDTEEDE